MRRSWTGRDGVLLAVVLAVIVLMVNPAPALAENHGFWYGADGTGPGPANSSAPYQEPSCGSGHAYGAYIGKIGGADLITSSNPNGYGPGHTAAWNSTYAADANNNHFNHARGVGAGGYWFLYGPNDTRGTGETSPYFWGNAQGTRALEDWQRWYGGGTHRMPLRILWADVEEVSPGTASYGWSATNHAANRQVFNGFYDAVKNANEGVSPGVYSTQSYWNAIMSGHTSIPNTWEWTAQVSRANSPAPCPNNFSPSSSFHAVFFGGQNESSAHAALWQWSQGTNDYDQVDANKSLPD